MFQTTVHTPPGERYFGFEDGTKALELGHGSIGKVIRNIVFEKVG